MEAKLARWGDDRAVRFSAEDVRALGVSEGQSVEVLPKRPQLTREQMFAEMNRIAARGRTDAVPRSLCPIRT